MKINWSSVGEWVYIVIFCTAYAIGANIQSRLHPAEGSLAVKARARAMLEVERIRIEESREYCIQTALESSRDSRNAIVWYHNHDTNEYWCGFIVPSRLTVERAEELKPHLTVLNSDNYILEVVRESYKYNSR